MSDEQNEKALHPMMKTDDGIETCASDSQYEKAEDTILLTVGIETFVSDVHL